MGYGFRVFNVTAHKNGRGDALGWGSGLREHLVLLLAELASAGELVGTPYLKAKRADVAAETEEPDSDPSEEGQPLVMLSEASAVDERHLHLVMSYGKIGRHPQLAGGGEPVSDIRRRAALADFRVDILLPAKDGELALAVVETSGNECPRQLLNLHLSSRSRERVRDNQGKRTGEYVGFRFHSQPDGSYLKKLIAEADSAEAVFRDLEGGARGNPRQKSVLRSLNLNLKQKHLRDKAVKHVNAWVVSALEDAEETDVAQAVKAMEQDLGVADGIESLGWDVDDVEVVLRDKNGKPKIYGPGLLRAFFTYPVSNDVHPADSKYYDVVVPRVQDLETQYHLGISTKSATEVTECLTASTSETSSSTPVED